MSAVIQALGEIADKKFKKEEAERKASRAVSSDLARQTGLVAYAAFIWKEYHTALSKLAIVLLYYMVGILFYHYNMGWNVNDCIYFITVSVTTVGYGDYSPDNDSGRIFTIFFVLLGIAFIFAIINDFATSFIRSVEAKALEKLDDDPTDDKAPHGWKIAISIGTILLVVFLGSIFFMINEDWSFAKAFYWCFITSMTVGYGDLSLKYESSRTFSIFYILITVIVVAAAIGNFGAVQAEIAAEKKKLELLNRKLDLKMILEMDQDGDGVDKVEFLTAMLVANNGLDKAKDIDPWIKRFTELDKDGSGMLDKEDLELFAQEEERKTQQLKERITGGATTQGSFSTMSPFQTTTPNKGDNMV